MSLAPTHLLQEIKNNLNDFNADPINSGSARTRALEAAKKLVIALENPAETILQHAFSGSVRLCTRLAIDSRLFHLVVQADERPISAAELAACSGMDHGLLIRIMRVLNASGFVGEASEENYTATGLTKAMTIPALESGVRHTYDHDYQVLARMHKYFQANGYKNPTDSSNTPFQMAFGTKLNYFEYLAQDGKKFKDFDAFMTLNRNSKPHWTEYYPVRERIIDEYLESKAEDAVFMVDVGGGLGHDLGYFNKKFPHVGSLVLQELPHTLASVSVDEEIQKMQYDFFTPQPIKGAKVYFFHYIIHDWPDDKALEILRNVAEAMTPGYSKLILNEFLIPPTGCDMFRATVDIHMMADFSSAERSEPQFQALLESAGLHVAQFWQPPSIGDGVIEAVRKAA